MAEQTEQQPRRPGSAPELCGPHCLPRYAIEGEIDSLRGTRDALKAQVRERDAQIARLTEQVDRAELDRDGEREFRRKAEAEQDKWHTLMADVTAALGLEGGAFYDDVPKHVRALRAERDTAFAATQKVAKELMDALHEPMYAGSRDDWKARAQVAEMERDAAQQQITELEHALTTERRLHGRNLVSSAENTATLQQRIATLTEIAIDTLLLADRARAVAADCMDPEERAHKLGQALGYELVASRLDAALSSSTRPQEQP